MENNEVIRLNIKIHPDKDPALYKLLISITKEARARRLINLAATGMLSEIVGIDFGTPNKITHLSDLNEANEVDVVVTSDIEISASDSNTKQHAYDDEVLATYGEIYT